MNNQPAQQSSANSTPTSPPLVCNSFSKTKIKRLVQILHASQIALLVVSIITMAAGRQQDNVIMLATGSLGILLLCVSAIAITRLTQDYRAALEELARENMRMQTVKNHIEHLANHDTLTGLPNHTLAQRNFDKAYYQDKQQQQQLFGIIFIDLDNLKPINDSLGHQAGDKILKEVALRLLSYTKKVDSVCRYGGDEFIVFLPNIESSDQASQASIEILQLVSENYLYRNMLDHISLISGMRKALQEQQFSLHYQPKIDLRTNKICGLEALLRWHHHDQGFISPVIFIPLAESSGIGRTGS